MENAKKFLKKSFSTMVKMYSSKPERNYHDISEKMTSIYESTAIFQP